MGFLDHFKKTDVPATPQLKDFHPVDTGLSQAVRDLAEEFGKKELPAPIPCGRDQFIALLAGVPALRRMPGIPGPGEMRHPGGRGRMPGPSEKDFRHCGQRVSVGFLQAGDMLPSPVSGLRWFLGRQSIFRYG